MKNSYSQILDDPRFQELVSKRNRLSWTLSALILIVYLAFIFLIAFAPQVLGTRISADSVITWGIPIGVGLILFAFILTGIYVRRANGEFDRLTKAILDEVQQ
ncbi:DUF485 domain-containing protein [Carnimonas nigrificans]|uniref:DUF485 domain-containing protein n=1 Tax=Carnimonas nigrificans TaxID=64323 RepID=UPI0004721182|nr:DUF485 domain-containing protein [Carnimonas nigrificans]